MSGFDLICSLILSLISEVGKSISEYSLVLPVPSSESSLSIVGSTTELAKLNDAMEMESGRV